MNVGSLPFGVWRFAFSRGRPETRNAERKTVNSGRSFRQPVLDPSKGYPPSAPFRTTSHSIPTSRASELLTEQYFSIDSPIARSA